MSKVKQLKEQRAAIFSQIDELRHAADGREMTSEEQQRWNGLMAEYDKADKEVEKEERFEEIQRRQAEQQAQASQRGGASLSEDEAVAYRTAFADYLINGLSGMRAENRALFEKRDSITGLTSGGVIIPATLASQIEIALKSYGGMFEAGHILNTAGGGDLVLPTVNDTAAKATIVAEYAQSTRRAPSFGSVTLKAFTYRTPIIPVSLELLQDSTFNLDTLLSGLLSESFGRGINEQDFDELLRTISEVRGRFMLTMFPHPLLQKYVEEQGWTVHTIEHTITASKTSRRRQEEWMVTNY